jgi:hypothetical protein
VEGSLTGLTYFACALLIASYSWDRFNTPASNRSSTRRALYWSSFFGYLACALALFAMLAALLQVGAWRSALLGHEDDPGLPAPLMATLALTALLPSVPLLKRLDARILAAFHEWGEIPAEARRLAAEMTSKPLSVTDADVAELRTSYEDGSYGDALGDQLVSSGESGLQRSRLRLTRLLKLFDTVTRLAREENYGTFYDEADQEYAALKQHTGDFLRRSAVSLALAARLQCLETQEVYEDLVRERRQAFAQACEQAFAELALFLARAVLRSEVTERDILARLRQIGFQADPVTLPEFPIDSLTALGLGVFAYLAGLSLFFSHVPSVSQQTPGMFVMTLKIGLIRIVTVGMTIWLLQRYGFFRRGPNGSPRYFAYFLCGVIASVVSLLISLPFHVQDADLLAGLQSDAAPVVLSGMLCAVLAFCCDDGLHVIQSAARRRLFEALACGSVVLAGEALIYFDDLFAFPITGWMVASWFALPCLMAMAIGYFVPHIYRAAREAVAARREEPPALVPGGAAAVHVS